MESRSVLFGGYSDAKPLAPGEASSTVLEKIFDVR